MVQMDICLSFEPVVCGDHAKWVAELLPSWQSSTAVKRTARRKEQ